MINPIPFLLCHLTGDYWLQSDWMAMNKSKKTIPCLVHVLIYTSLFLFLTLSWKALLFIGTTHFIIDRFPIIIKKLIWWKNHINPKGKFSPWSLCNTTGYYDDSPYNSYTPLNEFSIKIYGQPRPFFLTMWLYIISDNIIHLICNYVALTYLQ